MAAELYNTLFDKTTDHAGSDALVAALAQLGRIQRAAAELADDELAIGMWVRDDMEQEERMRFAADDRDSLQVRYSGGVYGVEVIMGESGWTVKQTDGPAGASLKVSGEWVVLIPGETVALPVDGWVEHLILVDLTGQEVILKR
jgi:hypothetical protein